MANAVAMMARWGQWRKPGTAGVPLVGIAASLLAGCSIPATMAPQPLSTAAVGAASSISGSSPDWPAEQWWTAYGDPQLDGLIAEAERGSPDIRLAVARVQRAAAVAQQAAAALMPTLAADGQVAAQKQSYNMGFPEEFIPHGWRGFGMATLGGSFDLDLWGRNRAALRAATSEAEAARFDAVAGRLLVTTAVAAAYADLARLFLERDVAERAVAVRRATLQLVTQRADIGLDNRGPQRLAESRLPAAMADLAGIDEQIGLARNRIAALLGDGPDRGLAINRPAAGMLQAHGLPTRLALDLLGRRPDIQAARARAEASVSRVRAARADFFPNVNLMAFVGVQALGLRQLTDSGSAVGSAGPALHLPLFEGGRLTGAYRDARADHDAAVASYDATLVNALHEVADVATSLRALSAITRDSAASLAAAEQAYGIAQQRFGGGLATYLDVLNAEDTLLDQRRADARVRARAMLLDVALVRALGGGFRAQ